MATRESIKEQAAAPPPEEADEPTEELELTPMGNRRSAVTESDELDYRVPEPSLLKRSPVARAPMRRTRSRSPSCSSRRWGASASTRRWSDA